MTTAAKALRESSGPLPVVALVVGVMSVFAWFIPGVVGMIAVGLCGSVAIALATLSLCALGSAATSPAPRRIAVAAVVVGLLGLAGVWVTAVLVAAIPM